MKQSEIGSRYAKYVLFVLLIVYIFNFIDRQILSILAEEIKADLGVSDAEIGFLYGTRVRRFLRGVRDSTRQACRHLGAQKPDRNRPPILERHDKPFQARRGVSLHWLCTGLASVSVKPAHHQPHFPCYLIISSPGSAQP